FDCGSGRVGLVECVADGYLRVNGFSPGSAARGRRAAVVDADDEISLLRQHRMPHLGSASPRIEHCLPPRFAVDVKERRVAFLWIEVRRFDYPAVELNAITDRHAEELRLALPELAEAC